MADSWEKDALEPNEYHVVEAQRGREFILRLTTGADVFYAIQHFAQDHHIHFAKIHAAFMGGLQPARLDVWVPDTLDSANWHRERTVEIQNLSMVLSMGGVIHPRPVKGGGEEPFPAIHCVIGGAWDVPTVGGHMMEGTLVKGVLEVFITEIKGIEVLYPSSIILDPSSDEAPENWYRKI